MNYSIHAPTKNGVSYHKIRCMRNFTCETFFRSTILYLVKSKAKEPNVDRILETMSGMQNKNCRISKKKFYRFENLVHGRKCELV